MKRVIVLGGGTFEPIRNHLSLCAPAFGTTAKFISDKIGAELYLTKMADSNSKLVTNSDVSDFIDELLEDDNVSTIVLSVAFCDFKTKEIDGIENGFHSERLKTANGDIDVTLTPTDKIISKIRVKRPDIFLIGFKTTTGKESNEQFSIALKMMKATKCNLVLANDTVTRNNMIITPEETIYGETTNRNNVLNELCDMIKMRNNLTYERSNHIISDSIDINSEFPTVMKQTLHYLIDNGGFIENNGNGFTPGHFCYKNSESSFISSQRKANHNLVFSEGASLVVVKDDKFTVYGKRKASVGARSQWMLLNDNPGYDCIIHTHNPLVENSKINIVSQKPFQCGSLECGLNTMNGMIGFNNGIKAVYLDKHGSNIIFKSNIDFQTIKNFIDNNIELGVKTK